jgi:hypothetical protein
MNLRFLCFLLILSTCQLQGQNYKWSVSLNYPITIDQNFIGENYTGFLDAGLSYHCVNFEYVSIGTTFNAGILSNNDNLDISSIDSYKAIVYSLEPKINFKGTIPSLEMVHPYLGLGYSFFIFDISGVNQGLGIVEDGETLYGFSFNTGFQVDLSIRFYINLEYDFTRVERTNLVPDTRYNKNINFVKLGAGYRF